MDEYLSSLGACRLRNIVCGDDASDLETQFETWTDDLVLLLSTYLQGQVHDGSNFVSNGLSPPPPSSSSSAVDVDSTAGGDTGVPGVQMSKTMIKKLLGKK